MGDSLPPPAAIDLVGSYARRRGNDVEVVLWDPKLGGTSGALVLSKGRATLEGQVELVHDHAGRRIVGRAPRDGLNDGIWSMTLRSPDSDDEPIDARLLVQGERPVVLLWGAQTKASHIPKTRKSVGGKRKVAASAGRMADRVLAVLPQQQATKIRAHLRTSARRVLK